MASPLIRSIMNKITILLLLLLPFFACQNTPKNTNQDLHKLSWQEIENLAQGTTVQMSMWQGDPLINRFMQETVVPALKKRYNITLNINAGQGNELVKIMLAEKETNQSKSSMDMCWINGETFFQLRQINALYGSFVSQLLNSQYINNENLMISTDFQQPTDGFECPWGNVQFAMIYDSLRTPTPPRTMAEIETYVKSHPNRFTIPYEFTGMTLLKSWLIALSGDKNGLNGAFDEAKYQRLSAQLWDFINRNKVYFWRKGETFPENLATTHQMFANGELDFTMSNNDSEVDNKIAQNIFAPSAKAYVFESGTIQNSHYWGIPALAENKAGAMVVANFLISPEAQWQKNKPDVWGDGTVLNLEKLPAEWQEKFKSTQKHTNAPDRKTLQSKALQEPAPEYMIRLFEDFKKKVLQK
jgi:putative spermidine/putrescine transport system substrate-binding protein